MKIDSNIKMPPKCSGKADVIRSMKVGDSTIIEAAKRNAWGSVAKSVGFKIAVRTVDGKCRMWRTA